MRELRPELPPLPERMQKLPISRGYPVPWFVEWIDGEPEFRVMDGRKIVQAVREHLCWVCGQRLGSFMAFTIGPMCAVNRVSAEPPSHRECSIYSATACPFLSRPHMRRRANDLPEEAEKPSGVMIERNPGVTLVWITKGYKLMRQAGSPLFRIGDPRTVLLFAQGRPATPDEVHESIVSGLPFLTDAAKTDGRDAVRELARDVRAACSLLRIPPIELAV